MSSIFYTGLWLLMHRLKEVHSGIGLGYYMLHVLSYMKKKDDSIIIFFIFLILCSVKCDLEVQIRLHACILLTTIECTSDLVSISFR